MSFLLLFQPSQESPGTGIAGLELGSRISASGSFDLDAEINIVDVAVDYDGEDIAIELFTNYLTFDFGVTSRARVYFGVENSIDIAAIGRTSCLVGFEPEPSFDILVEQDGRIVVEFRNDEAARFFDISIDGESRMGITFARSRPTSTTPESDEDIALRYREFIV